MLGAGAPNHNKYPDGVSGPPEGAQNEGLRARRTGGRCHRGHAENSEDSKCERPGAYRLAADAKRCERRKATTRFGCHHSTD